MNQGSSSWMWKSFWGHFLQATSKPTHVTIVVYSSSITIVRAGQRQVSHLFWPFASSEYKRFVLSVAKAAATSQSRQLGHFSESVVFKLHLDRHQSPMLSGRWWPIQKATTTIFE